MEKKLIKNRLICANMSESIFEYAAWSADKVVIGVDEVGRGSLAGPVVTCALILKPYATHLLLQDSKLLSKVQRNKAYAWICNNAWYAFGIVNHYTIDEINIYQATLRAMEQAYWSLMLLRPHVPSVDTVLVDAMPLYFDSEIKVQSFIKGEQRSISIAAASIMAKVMRDDLMDRLSLQFPYYHFASNKGYGSASHLQAITQYGPSIVHRTTFIRSFAEQKERENYDKPDQKQYSLFG